MNEEQPEEKSKTQLKQEMLERQELGKKLTALNKTQLKSIPIDETTLEAILDYQRFKKREAKRRQLQFIGKLMRSEDYDAVQQAWELTQAGSEAQKKLQHKLEYWRDKLIREGDGAINEAMEEFDHLDRQQLRQLIRQAQKEAEANKAPAASRKIFQLLK